MEGRLNFLVLVAVLLWLPASCLAEVDNTFYIQQSIARFFNLPQSARGLALAGTETPLSLGSASVFGNPAGLGFMKFNQVSGSIGFDSHTGSELFGEREIEENSPSGYLLAAFPLIKPAQGYSNAGTVGFGYSRYNGSTNDSINSVNDGHTRTGAYGLAISDKVSLGYGFTFYDDQLRSDLADYHSHSRFRHGFGSEYRVSPNLNLGLLLVYGLGQSDFEEFSVMSNGLTHQKQLSGNLGATYQIDRTLFAASLSFDHYSAKGNLDELPVVSNLIVVGDDEDGSAYGLHLGVEHSIAASWLIRGGYQFQNIYGYEYQKSNVQTQSSGVQFSAFSAGIGYTAKHLSETFPQISLDYGLQYRNAGNGEWEHMLSASLDF